MESEVRWIGDGTLERGGVRFHLDLPRERPVSSGRLAVRCDVPGQELAEPCAGPVTLDCVKIPALALVPPVWKRLSKGRSDGGIRALADT